MIGVSGSQLATETCRAGALGFLAGGHLTSLEPLQKEISLFREKAGPDAPLCIGFIGHSSLNDTSGWNRVHKVLDTNRPDVVQFFAPGIVVNPDSGQSNVQLAQGMGSKVLAQACSLSEAQLALEAGVDGLIVQGSESGGHGYRRELGSGTFALSARVANIAGDTPVLAAGGIVDGRGLAAALALGCDGVALGTRLWASQEALGHASFKEQLAYPAIQPDSVIRTTVIDQIQNTYLSTPWPAPYDSVGTLRNKTTEKWEGRAADLAAAIEAGEVTDEYRDAVQDGDPDIASVLCGEGVGDIHSIDRVYDILTSISDDAMSTLRSLSSKHLSE